MLKTSMQNYNPAIENSASSRLSYAESVTKISKTKIQAKSGVKPIRILEIGTAYFEENIAHEYKQN